MMCNKKCFLVVAVSSVSVLAAADDPFAGTWNEDVARSHYQGMPAPTEMTLTISDEGNMRVLRFNGQDRDGSPIRVVVSEPIAGGEVEVKMDPSMHSMGAPYDKIKFRAIDARHRELVYRRGGREVGTRRVEISEDGRIQRAWYTETTPNGKKIVMNDVLNKQ